MSRAAFVLASLAMACCARTGLDVDRGGDAGRDGGADAGFDGCVEPPREPRPDCPLDAPNASVSGMTPFGALTFEYAWAGYLDACAGDYLVLGPRGALEGGPGSAPALPSLDLRFLSAAGGAGEVEVTLRASGCRTATTRGVVEVIEGPARPGDDPRGIPGGLDGFCACDGSDAFSDCEVSGERRHVSATVRVRGDGWDLAGDVRAPHCHALHGICF